MAVLVLAMILVITGFVGNNRISSKVERNYALLGVEAPILMYGDLGYRDLNKNGRMDVYEDPAAAVEDRVEDLLARMTLEEKVGTMFISMIGMTPEGEPIDKPFSSTNPIDFLFTNVLPSSSEMIAKRLMNSFNIIHGYEASVMATFNNKIQKLAERTRLGIPVTIATDPRHGTSFNPGPAIQTPSFSKWPSSLGLAATRDTLLVREFGNVARQEYMAIGIRLALHPMADLATEPRWGRINGTFGEDAELAAQMTRAYILGFQGDTLGTSSVACMTKHFSGGGPQLDGEDAHFPYGREQTYPGNNFDYHLIPFEKGAFPAHTAQIMPYYGIPLDQTDENVGFGFNKAIITGMLREKYGFKGVICTDWGIISGSDPKEARAWGVEHLSPVDRVKKVLDAGCDQFGGETGTDLVLELLREGRIEEARIDVSVRRILRDKFTLGLFDDPYLDVAEAEQVAGQLAFDQLGKIAQAKSAVLLKNEGLLPLRHGVKIYAWGMEEADWIGKLGVLVENPIEADVIVARIRSPFEKRNEYFLEQYFHQGRLYYDGEESKAILDLISKKPSVVVANLERPVILTEIDAASGALIADFGISDEVLAELLFGRARPQGKLPFELPSSWEAVLDQKEDVPYDSKDPLYPFGYGLSYAKE